MSTFILIDLSWIIDMIRIITTRIIQIDDVMELIRVDNVDMIYQKSQKTLRGFCVLSKMANVVDVFVDRFSMKGCCDGGKTKFEIFKPFLGPFRGIYQDIVKLANDENTDWKSQHPEMVLNSFQRKIQKICREPFDLWHTSGSELNLQDLMKYMSTDINLDAIKTYLDTDNPEHKVFKQFFYILFKSITNFKKRWKYSKHYELFKNFQNAGCDEFYENHVKKHH